MKTVFYLNLSNTTYATCWRETSCYEFCYWFIASCCCFFCFFLVACVFFVIFFICVLFFVLGLVCFLLFLVPCCVCRSCYYFHCPSINDESKRKMKQFGFVLVDCMFTCFNPLFTYMAIIYWKQNQICYYYFPCHVFVLGLVCFFLLFFFWCLAMSVCLATTSFRCLSINDQNKRKIK